MTSLAHLSPQTTNLKPGVASNLDARYCLPVAVNPANGLGGPNCTRRNSAPITIAGAFFVPAFLCYGGLRRSTLGCAGLLVRRSANPAQPATLSAWRQNVAVPKYKEPHP